MTLRYSFLPQAIARNQIYRTKVNSVSIGLVHSVLTVSIVDIISASMRTTGIGVMATVAVDVRLELYVRNTGRMLK